MDGRKLLQEFRALDRNRRRKLVGGNYCVKCDAFLYKCKCEVTFTLSEIVDTINFFLEEERNKRIVKAKFFS